METVWVQVEIKDKLILLIGDFENTEKGAIGIVRRSPIGKLNPEPFEVMIESFVTKKKGTPIFKCIK